MKKNILLLTFLISSICFTSFTAKNFKYKTESFIGKYNGQASTKTFLSKKPTIGKVTMTLEVYAGDSSNEIKILYGAWLTKAIVDSNKFQIIPTSFESNSYTKIIISGNGEFTNNKMTIHYVQDMNVHKTTTRSELDGTLDKL